MRLAVFLLATPLLVGCTHVTYTTRRQPGAYHEGATHFYFWGLAGREDIAVDERCPGGAAKAHVYTRFADGLLTIVTLGIYAPRSFEVWCASPSAQAEVQP